MCTCCTKHIPFSFGTMDSYESYTIPFEDFKDVNQIGCAGTATVIHKASWKSQNNRQVAIKIYNKQLHDKEVTILRKLHHPNIIKFYGIVNPPFSSGIVIEYASGGDLLNFLASKRKEKVGVRLPRRQFTHWCLDIAVAIQYLHGRHITHKDIKSPNVLLSDDIIHEKDEESLNRLKICDFGISKELTSTESVVSRYGGCTKSWAAPEVIADDRVVSQKSDIYSLCVVFWELWTCQQPWSDHLVSEIETKVKRGTLLEIPTDFPELMKPMMLKCWQMERNRRCEIYDVIACIKRLMFEWKIKVCQENTSENHENTQGGMLSEGCVPEEKCVANNVQQKTQLKDQEIANVPVQTKQDVEHSLTLEKTCDYKQDDEYEDIEKSGDDHIVEMNNISQGDCQQIPEGDIQRKSKEICVPVVAPMSEGNMQSRVGDAEDFTKQLTDTDEDESNEYGVFESGHFAEIVDHFESFGAQGNLDNEYEYVETPTTIARSDVAPILPPRIPVYQNLISPEPNNDDDYEYVETPTTIARSDVAPILPPCIGLPVHQNLISPELKNDDGYERVITPTTIGRSDVAPILPPRIPVHQSLISPESDNEELYDCVENLTTIERSDVAPILPPRIPVHQNLISPEQQNDDNYEYVENPTTIERSDVASILPPRIHMHKNLISPVPKIADYYDDVQGIWLPPKGKSGKELRKLYEHVEKSYKDLKLIKEVCIDNKRFHELLSSGELRHLVTNMDDLENIMTRIYTWFNKCRWQIPAICELITNILEADYLQPIVNFAIYSQLQMNMLNGIRYRRLDFPEKFTRSQIIDPDDNYRLSFTELQEILLKQANWLKKFHSILKSFQDALAVEMIEDVSVIQDLKVCCDKLHQIILNCNEHEVRIIRDIQHHSTSILQKLRFNRDSQRAMVSEESWVKKIGTIYLIEGVKQDRKPSVVERKKCTMMAFVSTVIIVEDKGEYLSVIDCFHKNNIKFNGQVYQDMYSTEDETLTLTKLTPVTKLPVKEYGFTLEDSDEIQEWTKAFEFSEEEKKSQDSEYITPMNIGLLDTTDAEPTYEDCYSNYVRMTNLYENLDAMQVLASIMTLNKKTIESLSKLIESYIDNVVLSSIIGQGEKHHLYLNVREVNEVIKSFNNCLETNQYDSFNLFTELRKHLENDSFHPIIEYQANLCFQRNTLQFQRKHPTAFSQVLGNLERDAHAKWRVSEMDLQVRLSKPADWLSRLYRNLKSLEGVIIMDLDNQETFHRLNANTLHMLQELILRGQRLKESVEQDYSKHITTVLLKLPAETINEPHLIQKLSNIQDDWIEKHDRMVLFTKRKKDLVNPLKKRYLSTQVNIYVSASAIILTSSSEETVENPKIDRFCRCYDRNYADMVIVDADSRESWMPERECLFKLWVYEKEDGEYKQCEYVIGLNSDRSKDDLLEWKSQLVVATGESGIFDDYRRPRHIVTESFITDREDELHLEIDDIVEIEKMQEALGKTWVKGMRLSDKKSGWFPRNKLGHEVDSEYNRGQTVKLRYQKERERKKESEDGKKKDIPAPKTGNKSKKSFVGLYNVATK